MKVIQQAAEALGGAARIEQVRTLTMEGEGAAWNLGQNRTPDGELPAYKVTEYSRSIDLSNRRMRTRQVRTVQFLFAGADVQRLDQGVDGEIGYNIAEGGAASRAPESTANDRRVEMLHHPIILVRAALDANARVENLRNENGADRVDIVTADGERLTLEVDPTTKLPARIESMAYNPNLGDVAVETAFTDYQTVSGLQVPSHITTKIDKYPQSEIRLSRTVVDADAAETAAPNEVRSMSIPPAAAVTVTAEEVGKGIWWLAGSGNHRSVVFEFADHLVLYEAPLNEVRTKAVIDTARTLRPDKPLTHVIVSHHHFDHSGGLRAAIAEGLTIITYRGNVELFKELAARRHSIVEDALARNPKPLKIEPVDDEMTLKDDAMEVHLYHVKENPREGTNLFAYVPRDRMLVQADLYDSTWLHHPWGDNLPYNLALHGLQVVKDVPVHGAIQSYSDVLKTIAEKNAAANN